MTTGRSSRLWRVDLLTEEAVLEQLYHRLKDKAAAELSDEEASLLPWPEEGHPLLVLALRCVQEDKKAAAAYLMRLSPKVGSMIAREATLRNPGLFAFLYTRGYQVEGEDLIDLLVEGNLMMFKRFATRSITAPKMAWLVHSPRLSDLCFSAALRTWPDLQVLPCDSQRWEEIRKRWVTAALVFRRNGLCHYIVRTLCDNDVIWSDNNPLSWP